MITFEGFRPEDGVPIYLQIIKYLKQGIVSGAVADGFSDLCVEVLQERGRHVRTVMGTRNMPNHNIPVEVELIFRLAEGYGEEA